MKINKLELVNVRAFTKAEFEFGAGMNLLVGVNGVGKSTVLDSLRYLLSNAIRQHTGEPEKTYNFKIDDIQVGLRHENPTLTAEVSGFMSNNNFSHRIEKHTKKFVPNPNWRGELKNQTIRTPDVNELSPKLKPPPDEPKPVAVFFSPHRSIVSRRKGKGEAAFVKDSLEPRELQIQEFANWLLAREELDREANAEHPQIKALNRALTVFLKDYKNLRAVKEPKPTLTIEKNNQTLDVRQLSDGERGVLTLVFDLTARLAEANPQLENPREAAAVVLIDEIDLHLHPRWQREIVDRLEETFPNCQFIATTHSPQIVGEVAPEKIYILGGNGEKLFKPNQSFGMDSNWILEYLMETNERNEKADNNLERIAELIEDEDYDAAQELIDAFKSNKQISAQLVRLQTRIDAYR